jgi:hypothetical protein
MAIYITGWDVTGGQSELQASILTVSGELSLRIRVYMQVLEAFGGWQP